MKKYYFIILLLIFTSTGQGKVIFSSSLPDFENMYSPDSIVSYYAGNPSSKIFREYNSANKCINRYIYNGKEVESGWIPYSRIQYEYSPNTPDGKNSLSQSYYWNTTSNEWEYDRKFSRQYNESGLETSMETYAWRTELAIWQGNDKDVLYYNNNQMIKVENYDWSYNSSDWNTSPRYIITYYYDKNSRLDSLIYKHNNYSEKEIYSYCKENDNIKSIELFQQMANSEIWNPMGKTIYTYNSNDKVIKKESLKTTNGEWVNSSMYNYDWDEVGRETLNEYYKWNVDSYKWIGESKQTSEYLDNYSAFTKYKWSDITNNDWLKSTKAVHKYNLNQQHISYEVYRYFLYPDFTTYEGESSKKIFLYNDNNKLFKIENYGENHTDLTSYEIYYYNNSPQSIDYETANSEVFVYYIGSNLIIDSPVAETIEIYSLSGKLINRQHKEAGKVALNTARQTEIIIIKGSSGWTKKLY